ncbi:hypothetical protein EPD60_12795 [Flaviaesturariibacter flavus]|uniref:Aspartyl protease n=1 Tax=Flaviaesturariibacter flavus TaxID=2502780 RepID=A0A4R1B978_9BACT|nr:hypothetical protein [Flaviaesturariibacter flavus]TCJ13269.1 hypothetical protein EPD60_12795 [Flaviaesturariibacter flavus]
MQRMLLLLILSFLLNRPSFAQTGRARILLAERESAVPFRWVSSPALPNSALLLPLRLPGCPETYYLQFDLGAAQSVLYREAFDDIAGKYPKSFEKKDALISVRDARLGAATLTLENMPTRSYAGSNPRWKKGAINIIGTAGADLLEGRTVLIDYPGGRLLLNADTTTLGSVERYSLVYAQGRILLPAQVEGERKLLIFDSGSSAFSLLTDAETAVRIATPGSVATQVTVRSWDHNMTANSFPTTATVRLAGRELPLGIVTYMEGATEQQVRSMKALGIGGMTGNRLFLKHRLLLDLQRRQFALLDPR